MKKLFLITAFICSILSAKAQEVADILVLGGNNASTMMQSYAQPAFEGTMYNLNSGWYRTAKTHKLLGFDISLNATLASVPSERESFTFNEADYDNITIVSGSSELPTFFGGESNTVLEFSQEVSSGGITTDAKAEFSAIDGFGDDLSQVPGAMIQAGIGLPFKTELTLRYVPESLVSNEEFEAGLLGVGIKHNVLQYFPIAKRIPLVDVSIFGGYTQLNAEYFPQEVEGSNQSMDMQITSMTAQLLGSIDLKIINFFVGLGYTTSEAELNVNGTYEFEVEATADVGGIPYTTTTTRTIDGDDVPSLAYDVNGFMTTAGMSINLAFFKIYGSYTLQEYNSINAGVAFSFR